MTKLLAWFIKRELRKIMIKKLKELAARKIKASFGSTTMAVAAAVVGVGVWLQENPDVLRVLVPENYEGVGVAAIGLLVAIARLRSLGK